MYFAALFESAPEAIAILDEQDQIIRINGQFTTMFGYTEDDAVGRNINDLIVPPQLVDDAVLMCQDQRVVCLPRPPQQATDIGEDIRVFAEQDDRLIHPGLAKLGNHDAKAWECSSDFIQEDGPAKLQLALFGELSAWMK